MSLSSSDFNLLKDSLNVYYGIIPNGKENSSLRSLLKKLNRSCIKNMIHKKHILHYLNAIDSYVDNCIYRIRKDLIRVHNKEINQQEANIREVTFEEQILKAKELKSKLKGENT